MTFISGTLTNPNPGPALYALIETAMLADGWTLVDTVVIGSNTHKVLKSTAAGNVQNLDWYLDINYPTTGISGGMRFAAFEDFNPATGLAYRGPYIGSSTIINATTFSRFGDTGFALESNWANQSSASGISAVLTTSAFGYRISVTRDRIIVSLDTQGSYMNYAGFFNPIPGFAATAGALLFPLITAKLRAINGNNSESQSSTATASLTRIPNMPSGASFNWAYNCQISGAYALMAFRSGNIADGVYSPSPLTGEIALLPMPVQCGLSVTGSFTDTWPTAYLGELLDVTIGSANSSVVRGDSVTVGSDTWYMSEDASNVVLLFKGV